MAKKRVIIIGAGLAGLSCGCYARMNGYDAHILEHHTVPGGVVAAWKRGDYLIDGGVHFLMGSRPGQATHELYRELGVLPQCPVSELPAYSRFVDEPSGISVVITRDLDRLASDLRAIAPEDSAAIDRLIAGPKALQGMDLTASMAEPPELKGLLDRVRQLWAMRGALRYMSGEFARPISEYAGRVSSPFLRRFLQNLFMPEVPVWFVLMLLALLADRQLGLLEKGSLHFARAIERRFAELGGEISYRSTVERILVESDRAVGIRLLNGGEHRADVVVSAADGYSTIFGMLEGRYADHETRRRYEEWPLIRPTVMVSLGINRDCAGESPSVGLLLDKPLPSGGAASNAMWLRILNYGPDFAPPGKCVVQASFEADWDFWENLRTSDRKAYDEEKSRVAFEVTDRLERHCPGISSQVEVTDVATPCTTWRYTRNRRGAYEGWLPTPKAIMTRIKSTLPGLAGFYMAGQWVVPGGGVPPCLYSGKQVVQLMCRADRKRFVAHLAQPG